MWISRSSRGQSVRCHLNNANSAHMRKALWRASGISKIEGDVPRPLPSCPLSHPSTTVSVYSSSPQFSGRYRGCPTKDRWTVTSGMSGNPGPKTANRTRWLADGKTDKMPWQMSATHASAQSTKIRHCNTTPSPWPDVRRYSKIAPPAPKPIGRPSGGTRLCSERRCPGRLEVGPSRALAASSDRDCDRFREARCGIPLYH